MPPPVPPSVPRLAWRQLRRDFAAGELRLLLWAVVLAVAALSAVGFFADRMRAGLWRDAGAMLGGDVVLIGDRPLPDQAVRAAGERGLQSVVTASFPSMARARQAQGGAARLASVKAVGGAYPLRGDLLLRAAPEAPARRTAGGPPRGGVWVDPALARSLGLGVGDALELGDATLRIAALVDTEPDRGLGFGMSNLAPRLLMNIDDLPATGLVQESSRVAWRLLVAAPMRGGDVPGFERWARGAASAATAAAAAASGTPVAVAASVAPPAMRGVRVETLAGGRPEMRQTLDRAERFLSLVALLSALLAAVAVAVAARDFAQRHLDDCALMRVLGQTQRRIAGVHALEFLMLGLLASGLGVAGGFVLHLAFVELLKGFVPGGLPWPGPGPALFGLGVGLTLLLGFGLPPVLQLARVPALRVLRRDVGNPQAASVGVLVGGLLGFAVLLLAAAGDATLGLMSVGGFAGAALFFAGVAWGAVRLLRRVVADARAPRALLLATRAIAARPAFAVLQVSAMALGLMALWLLVLLRTDLIDSWRQATPPDAADRFVINIQPDQAEAFRSALTEAGVRDFDWSPMIRGRLLSINGAPVGPRFAAADPQAKRLIEREFNLSHSLKLPAKNVVVAGAWVPGEADGASVEEGLAKTLGLKLGDRLVFDVAGTPLDVRVSSLRKLDWSSMRVNFFVLLPRAAMDEVPRSYISAFRAPAAASAPRFDDQLAARFPNVSSIDVSAAIAQVQGVIDQVIRAVELLFAFALVAGLVVLMATVNATREARAREFAIMRAVGASSTLLGQVQRIELAGVGALAGFLASTAALGIGWGLAWKVFEFSWNPPVWVPLAGAVSGAGLALLAGWWSLRGVLARPVTETLRRASV